jgi:hypothetical protein
VHGRLDYLDRAGLDRRTERRLELDEGRLALGDPLR